MPKPKPNKPFVRSAIAPVSNPDLELAMRDQRASRELSVRYDILNQGYAAAEAVLKALKPIHSVWIEYARESHPNDYDRWEVLGFAKYNGQWRICHGYDSDERAIWGEDGITIQPISECPIEVRVCAAKEVHRLHEAIVASKEAYVPKVDEAIRELSRLTTGNDECPF